MNFTNRREAGIQLGNHISDKLAQPENGFRTDLETVVLGLPRGGIEVAFEVARILNQRLEAFVVRKLGLPGQPELAMGAIASGGILILNKIMAEKCRITGEEINKVVAHERIELARRENIYGAITDFATLKGKRIIIVDDGLATGATMTAAALAVRNLGAAEIYAAAPVASQPAVDSMQSVVSEIFCLDIPPIFVSISEFYDSFEQVEDAQVRKLLTRSRLKVA
jgi:putative phosphoribosyl transferase